MAAGAHAYPVRDVAADDAVALAVAARPRLGRRTAAVIVFRRHH
ncbi:hypothetical protein [Streptomyces sp. NPDC003036]